MRSSAGFFRFLAGYLTVLLAGALATRLLAPGAEVDAVILSFAAILGGILGYHYLAADRAKVTFVERTSGLATWFFSAIREYPGRFLIAVLGWSVFIGLVTIVVNR